MININGDATYHVGLLESLVSSYYSVDAAGPSRIRHNNLFVYAGERTALTICGWKVSTNTQSGYTTFPYQD